MRIRTGMSWMAAVAPLLTIGAGACTGDAAAPVPEVTTLLSVIPTGGATDVDPSAPVVVEFNHALAVGMEEYAALHEGDVTGPEVQGTWTVSEDRMTLTFTSAAPLKPATTYTIHIGGGMMDADGDMVDLEQHGMGMGGEWATGTMMNGGMGNGRGAGMGMGGDQGGHPHMGEGWQHPTNGSYGMVFSFTTAR